VSLQPGFLKYNESVFQTLFTLLKPAAREGVIFYLSEITVTYKNELMG